VTRAKGLRDLLADEIVNGLLAPGAPLEEVELARRFGVSRTPVREAIRDLAASGLVEVRPHRSAIVSLPSLEKVYGMFEMLAELEALCAQFAAARMNNIERRRLTELHDYLASLVRDGDPERYHHGNEEFHALIYAGSHNDYLEEMTLTTRTRISPFSQAQFRTLGRLALSHAEHERVVTAIMRGDQAAAMAEMRGHIATVEVAYERFAEAV
jgi:DNA-binding GntR family transcriptional regulator